MGKFLNSKKAAMLFKDDAESIYFVDKTALLDELIPVIDSKELKNNTTNEYKKDKNRKYICITRPRRFGKSVMANMIAAYFGKGRDTRPIFDKLAISSRNWYQAHINQHNVIHITLNSLPADCTSYRQYINRIRKRLICDLIQTYPNAGIDENDALWDALNDILESEKDDEKFIFVLDEWDYIFHRDFVTDKDREEYIDFLSNLLKDQPYVEFVYMTGILPIAKYSSGSELNMFLEYTMTSEEKFSYFFGFTESEVDILFDKYQSLTEHQNITRDGLRMWYNGYHTKGGEHVYNPRSIVASLTNNNLGNYWTSAGPYDEIYYYVRNNTAAVRNDLALMVSGIPVRANIREYAASSMNLTTRDEIFSAMVVYGFLSYEKGYVSIPNKELMDKFDDMLQKEPSLGYVDFIFYPEIDREADGIILELKVNHTAKEALQQIKDKKYALKFEGKLGETRKYTGRILGVGIAYDKETKTHSCKIETLRDRL